MFLVVKKLTCIQSNSMKPEQLLSLPPNEPWAFTGMVRNERSYNAIVSKYEIYKQAIMKSQF